MTLKSKHLLKDNAAKCSYVIPYEYLCSLWVLFIVVGIFGGIEGGFSPSPWVFCDCFRFTLLSSVFLFSLFTKRPNI